MRSIAVTSQSDWKDFEFFWQDPWAEFRREVVRLGCRIVGLKENPDLVVVFNHKSRRRNFDNLKTNRSRTALVVFEPEVVAPANFPARNRSKYERVYVPSPMWKLQKEDRVFDWPQTSFGKMKSVNSSSNRQNRFVMILGNHISVGRSELYSLRREIASVQNMPLDVFGPNWSDSTVRNLLRGLKSLWRFALARDFRIRFPRKLLMNRKPINYLGTVENKFETYAKYKYAVVIENSADYLSEKLIDAVISGTIPIYVGPNLNTFGLPAELAYQVNGDLSSIREACWQLMESRDIQDAILHAGREFLRSTRYMEMMNTQALRKLANMIVTDLLNDEYRRE